VSEPRQWYRIENAAAQVAEVSIFDEISPWGVTAQDFVGAIKGITAPRTNLHLNTPGGDVFDGIAIFNAIKDHPSEFHVFIPGLCASIGTVIAMAASRIVIAPHARMMIHEAWGGTMGDAADMAKMAERLEATSQNIATIYAERAGGTADEWRALMKTETWYTDQQAVDAGLADEVGRSNDDSAGKQAALFNLSRYRHGERIAASLRADFGVEVAEHVCVCGGSECPLPSRNPTSTSRSEKSLKP
jgi:ATP-dependent protease ClpP protease subunit